MKENQLIVNTIEGTKFLINVYDIVEKTDINKKYIIYDIDGAEEDDMYISILEETETSFTLKNIEDENEYKMIEEYLENINNKVGEN